MKKLIAVFLCMVMCLTMIPSFFASASPLPAEAAAAEAEVVAQNDESGGDLLGALQGFVDLWGGLLQLIVGEHGITDFLEALKNVLKLVSLGEFFKMVGQLWNDVTKR